MNEKLNFYRETVRQHPESAELKEALVGILTLQETLEGAFPDPAIYREMAELTESILEAGGGSIGKSHHQSQLVYLMKKLNNVKRTEQIANDSPRMEACQEMLLPSVLSGRAQINARKDLIFKCTDAIINTVYDMYAENSDDLTEDEWNALASAENVVSTVYGKNFSEHFVLVRGLYKAVQASLKKERYEEAVQRLQIIVDRLKLQENESAQINPLILEKQIVSLYLSHLKIFSIKMDSMWLIENILKDFFYEGAPNFKEEYPQFKIACDALNQMMDSEDGQMQKDALEMLQYIIDNKHTEDDVL